MNDFLVDVHGLRTFRVSDDGNLLPVTALDDSWRGGLCVATCRRDSAHQAPVEGCRCGIYTFRDLQILREQYEQADFMVAVIALEGQTLAGSRGWRSQAARVLALWVAPGALPDALMDTLALNLPDVVFVDDLDQMLASYPGLSVTAVRADRKSHPPVRRWAGVRTIKAGRIPIYLLVTLVSTIAFLFAERHQGNADAGLWARIGDAATYVGSHVQDLVFPILVVALWVRSRRFRGAGTSVLVGVLRVVIPLFIAAGLAQLLVLHTISIEPTFLVYFLLIGWLELWQFANSLGRTDGAWGTAARRFLHAGRNGWRVLRPSRRATGVNFTSHLRHPIEGYTLVMPVHFEAPGFRSP